MGFVTMVNFVTESKFVHLLAANLELRLIVAAELVTKPTMSVLSTQDVSM